jgi:hypothetical protein
LLFIRFAPAFVWQKRNFFYATAKSLLIAIFDIQPCFLSSSECESVPLDQLFILLKVSLLF